jgi:UDP-glucose 4-epimerase
MKVGVVGGAGFIGSHTVDKLIEEGHQVTVFDDLSTGDLTNVNSKAKFVKCDVVYDNLDFNGLDVIYHFAAQISVTKSVGYPVIDAKENIIGLINVLEHMRLYDVPKIIFSSSMAIYGNPQEIYVDEMDIKLPNSPYGVSKLCCEEYIYLYNRLYNLDFTILRYANVYGERQRSDGECGVISIFCNNIKKKKKPSIFGDGEQTRDYIHVSDVVRANIMALDDWSNNAVCIGTGKRTSVNQIANIIQKVNKITFYHVDERPGEVRHVCYDVHYANNLGFVSEINIEKGIVDLLKK